MNIVISLVFCVLMMPTAVAAENAYSAAMSQRNELENLKKNYRDCIFTKTNQFLAVSDVETAIKYTPIACRREFLKIRASLVGSMFKEDITYELLQSVETGIEIEMVNHILAEALKKSIH